MAMLSMCFQLMQDEMVAKFKWLGQKCGLCQNSNKSESREDEDSLPMRGPVDIEVKS